MREYIYLLSGNYKDYEGSGTLRSYIHLNHRISSHNELNELQERVIKAENLDSLTFTNYKLVRIRGR